MLDDDLLQVGLARDWAALQASTVKVAAALGFGMASGARIVGRLSSGKATVQSFGNPPDGFAEASKSLDLGLRDPVLNGLLARPGFVRYSGETYQEAGAGDLADLLAPFGYRHGLAFAMHEPSHGEVFFFGLDGPDALPAAGGSLLELQATLQLLTLSAKTAVRQLVVPPGASSASLTAIETECLKWEAAGAIWRAGEVLHLSDAALASQARSAARKLGAQSARGAALCAIRGGLIEP